MLSVFFQGVAMGAALILPLGPQNAFVMNQGVRRQYHLMTAALCTLSDIVLICGGIFGGSALLNQSALLLNVVTWGGVAFLLWYGWGALRTAFSGDVQLASAAALKQGRWRIVATMMAVTWLNPHVYLDTFVVLGSLGDSCRQKPAAGSPSALPVPPCCGFSAWRCWRPGWHRCSIPRAPSVLSTCWLGW